MSCDLGWSGKSRLTGQLVNAAAHGPIKYNGPRPLPYHGVTQTLLSIYMYSRNGEVMSLKIYHHKILFLDTYN